MVAGRLGGGAEGRGGRGRGKRGGRKGLMKAALGGGTTGSKDNR